MCRINRAPHRPISPLVCRMRVYARLPVISTSLHEKVNSSSPARTHRALPPLPQCCLAETTNAGNYPTAQSRSLLPGPIEAVAVPGHETPAKELLVLCVRFKPTKLSLIDNKSPPLPGCRRQLLRSVVGVELGAISIPAGRGRETIRETIVLRNDRPPQ